MELMKKTKMQLIEMLHNKQDQIDGLESAVDELNLDLNNLKKEHQNLLNDTQDLAKDYDNVHNVAEELNKDNIKLEKQLDTAKIIACVSLIINVIGLLVYFFCA